MSDEPEPKIIIDEDWKTQVQREKEELQTKEPESESADVDSAQSESNKAASNADPGSSSEEMQLPEASFSFLVTSLASQAVMSLGQMPGPDGEPVKMNLGHAKHFIDTLGVLEEKTKGNLDQEEEKFLQETLHQIRMMYVALSSQQQ